MAGERPSIAHLLSGQTPGPAPTSAPAPGPTPAPGPAPTAGPPGTVPSPPATPAPAPGPAPTAGPPGGAPSSPGPAYTPQPTPTPPAPKGGGGGSGSITYTDSALLRFAQTSDERATSFNQAYTQAQHIQVDRDAFGYMFGALVYSSYEEQAQSVSQGLQFASEAMSSIASAIRLSVSRIDQDNQSIVQSLPKG
jgi:hypothetical protein